MYSSIFAIISAIILIFGGPSYLTDILKGKTKPERVTWFIWSILGIIAFFSQLQLGAHWSLVYVGLDAAGNVLVFCLSLKYGVGGWARWDMTALSIASLGVLVSIIAHAPLIALSGVILADAAGAVLTIRKAYKNPGSETVITWLAIGTAALLSAFSVGRLRPVLLLYPLYLVLSSYGVLVSIRLGRRMQKVERQSSAP
jgi:hypothetical protein